MIRKPFPSTDNRRPIYEANANREEHSVEQDEGPPGLHKACHQQRTQHYNGASSHKNFNMDPLHQKGSDCSNSIIDQMGNWYDGNAYFIICC